MLTLIMQFASLYNKYFQRAFQKAFQKIIEKEGINPSQTYFIALINGRT